MVINYDASSKIMAWRNIFDTIVPEHQELRSDETWMHSPADKTHDDDDLLFLHKISRYHFFSLYIVISCCNEHLFGLLYLYSDSQLLCFVIVVPVSLSLFFILVGLARQIVICRDRQRPHVTLMYAYVSARLPVCLHTFVHMFTCTFVICVYACICMQGHMYE